MNTPAFSCAHLDVILVASTTQEEHLEHLCKLCHLLDANGIIMTPAKCVLGAESLKFLGHQVDRQGIWPIEEKVEAVRQFPQPTYQQRFCQFLGLVNFYHHFNLGYVHTLQPLHTLLTGSAKSDQHLTWTPEAETPFTAVKDALADATLLVHPQTDAPTCLITDSSDVAVGAVLQQCINSVWSPPAYLSCKLPPAESRYSSFDWELLVVYLAIRYFSHYVEDMEFFIITDHKPPTFVLATQSKQHLPLQVQYLDFIISKVHQTLLQMPCLRWKLMLSTLLPHLQMTLLLWFKYRMMTHISRISQSHPTFSYWLSLCQQLMPPRFVT